MSILQYNGGATLAMAGKNCVAIASDLRLGAQAQTVSMNFKKVFSINEKLYVGLTGLATDVLSLEQSFRMRSNLYELNGLFQHKGVILLVSNTLTKKLITQLFAKWILNACSAEVHKTQINQCMALLGAEITNVRLLQAAPIDNRLDLSKSAGEEIVYINAAFTGNDYNHEFFEYKRLSGVKMLFFVYDLLPIEFPEYFQSDKAQLLLKRIINVEKCADIIIPISHDVGRKLSALFQTLGTQGPKIFPIESGVEESFLTNRNRIGAAYEPLDQFVIVSTIEPRKNHLMLLEIWRDFLSSGLEKIPKLYIIGRRGWQNENVFNFLDNCIALKPFVIELTDAPDDIVIEKLMASKAALFPSYGEGWGLPPVESLALGVPTICSDIPVLREATQERAMYIHPNDHFGWRNMILEISKMSVTDLREKKNDLMNFRPFLWNTSFEKLRVAINETALKY